MNIILFEADEASRGVLSGRDARSEHLLKILRKKAGDSFEGGIIGGNSGRCEITEIRDDGAVLFVPTFDTPPAPRLPVEAGLGFMRPIQLRRALRSLSSLGISRIALFGTELGEKSYRDTKLLEDGGARAAIIEGAAQARDTLLPELAVFPNLAAWLSRPLSGTRVAADNIRPGGTFSELAGFARDAFTVAVGSERGWSAKERALFETNGFLRLSLGSRALRSETAAVACTAFLCALL